MELHESTKIGVTGCPKVKKAPARKHTKQSTHRKGSK
jgi:hypothetical protein